MLHLLVNPNSSRGMGEKVLAAAEERLRAEQVGYDVFRSSARGETERHVRALTEAGEGDLVVVGGDGTLNEVVRGLFDPSTVRLGLLPAGTGNDFAAAAHIPAGVAALDLILGGEPKYTDYLECGNGFRSINIAGLGIDVDILERCERKKHGGAKSKYFRSLLVSLLKFRAVEMEVEADGEKSTHRALLAAACNGNMFGGGIPICPPASLDDGKLDLVVVDCPNRIKVPYYLILLMKGKLLTRSFAHHIPCTEARILPRTGGNVQYDGELAPTGGLDVRVVSGKLKVYRS